MKHVMVTPSSYVCFNDEGLPVLIANNKGTLRHLKNGIWFKHKDTIQPEILTYESVHDEMEKLDQGGWRKKNVNLDLVFCKIYSFPEKKCVVIVDVDTSKLFFFGNVEIRVTSDGVLTCHSNGKFIGNGRPTLDLSFNNGAVVLVEYYDFIDEVCEKLHQPKPVVTPFIFAEV
jgi:hypothetical protein